MNLTSENKVDLTLTSKWVLVRFENNLDFDATHEFFLPRNQIENNLDLKKKQLWCILKTTLI